MPEWARVRCGEKEMNQAKGPYFQFILIDGSEQQSSELIAFYRQTLEGADPHPLPENLRKFVAKVENLNLLILDGLPEKSDRADLLLELLNAARVGAAGENPDTNLGNEQLELVKKRLLHRVGKARGAFMNQVYWVGFWWAVLGILGITVLLSIAPESIKDLNNPLLAFSFSLLGIALGVSISATMRLRQVSAELIGNFDPYDFSPLSRFFYVTLLATGIFVLLYFDVVKLGVGSTLLNEFMDKPAIGLLIGLIAGVSEPVLANIFEARAKPETSDKPGSTHA